MGVVQNHSPVRLEHNFGVDPGNRDVALLDRPELALASTPDSEPDTFRLDHCSRTVFAQEDSDFAFGRGRKGSRGTVRQGWQPLHWNRLVAGRNGGLSFHNGGRQFALSGHFNQKSRSRLPQADEVPDFNRHRSTRGEPALIEESAVGATTVFEHPSASLKREPRMVPRHNLTGFTCQGHFQVGGSPNANLGLLELDLFTRADILQPEIRHRPEIRDPTRGREAGPRPSSRRFPTSLSSQRQTGGCEYWRLEKSQLKRWPSRQSTWHNSSRMRSASSRDGSSWSTSCQARRPGYSSWHTMWC